MKLYFTKSDAAETAHPDEPTERTLTDDESWVQLTYGELRSSPNGETIALLDPDDGCWVDTDGNHWSDIVIER